jgi:methionyl-tRNA synthetase
MASRYYVTTPIYYINDVPHLGSAYTTIAADVMVRYHRLRGLEGHFLTGTDEHGLKIQREAEERKVAPVELAEQVSARFRETWPKLGCAPDDFIRTSEPRHQQRAQELWKRIAAAGDIYLGHYEGLYCVRCEAYFTEKELTQPGNLCPIHGKPVELVKEESYFFRLSRYADRLLAYYAKTPSPVQPASRRSEVQSFVQGGLTDLSVSRTTFQWGIPVPDDPRHVMYVWFDALSNYWTALHAPEDRTAFWPPQLHLVGKDILRFHTVYWPAFLMSAGFSDADLPKQIYAHGFLSYGGQKMSKSLRNTVSPVALAEAISPTVGVDVVRYSLMRAISFGQDGDFSIQDVLARYSNELGNSLGNLLNRVLPFADTVPEKAESGPLEAELLASFTSGAAAAAEAFDLVSPTRALDAIWTVLGAANYYVDKAAPWAAKKSDPRRLGTIVATLVEVLEAVSIMIAPVMPTVADALRAQLGLGRVLPEVGRDQWPLSPPRRAAGGALRKGEPIFPRIEKDVEKALVARFSPPPDPAAAPPAAAAAPAAKAEPGDAKAAIAFDDFLKLDLRVGLVRTAERVKKKDKLLELTIDTGEAEPRRIIAGIALAYAPEQLVGKRVVVLCNLPPRDFGKGLVSHGMLLAAGDSSRVLTIDGEEAPGARIK